MWYVAVMLCGLSGPAPCLIRAHEEPHAARPACQRAVRALSRLHGLPPGAVGRFESSSTGAGEGKAGAQPFFHLGCVAYSQADAQAGVSLPEKIAKTLGPKNGAML